MKTSVWQILGVFLLLFMGLSACTPTPVERDIASLRDRLEALQDSLHGVDSAAVESALLVYRMHLEKLAPYAADTTKQAVLIADGTLLDRSARNLFKFQAQRRVWLGALQAGATRLDQLENDVRTEYLDTGKGRTYLLDEQGALYAVLHEARIQLHAAQWALAKKDSVDQRMTGLFTQWSSEKK
jgi:hypothetical protein